MKELIIVGASGFGREVLQWANDILKVKQDWLIKGFIDDNLGALDGYPCEKKILGTIQDWIPSENEVFTCAIAMPGVKEKVVNTLKSKGATFIQIVHPTAIIGDYCQIGEGLLVTPRAKISPDVKIGHFVTILGSGVGHDAIIGDFSTISGNCSVNGHVVLGKRVFVGSNACIAPSKKIGDDAFIGMGSVVVSNIKPGYKVMGNPAKKIDF